MACEIGAVIEAAAAYAGEDTWARIVDPVNANAGLRLLDGIDCVPTCGAGGLTIVSDVPATFVEVPVWPKGRVISYTTQTNNCDQVNFEKEKISKANAQKVPLGVPIYLHWFLVNNN